MTEGEQIHHTVAEALAIQQRACIDLGSPLYATLLTGLLADHASGGLIAELLEGRSHRPVHDALSLRLLGAVHRIVLDGRAPRLAAWYPSAGGSREGDPTPAFLETVTEHRAEIEAGLSRQVQCLRQRPQRNHGQQEHGGHRQSREQRSLEPRPRDGTSGRCRTGSAGLPDLRIEARRELIAA